MSKIVIEGKKLLSGTISISGAKNSAVALIPAAILSDEEVTIMNVPEISDTEAMEEILTYLGAIVKGKSGTIKINSTNIKPKEIPEEISKKLRASYYFMSALLAKYKHVCMYFPGGCSIGARPIDQTLKGYKALGATVIEEGNKYTVFADKLIGGDVYLDMPSVGATINTMLVAVKAEGITIINNAAKEPEIVNLATFLNNMGAKIKGAGTSEIRIEGVKKLYKATIEVIPDRIETGTYMIIGALIGNNLKIENIISDHVESLILKLKEAGVDIKVNDDYCVINKVDYLKSIKIKTLGFPGFPTDLQQPLSTLLTQCNGVSTIEETLYENRFKHLEQLELMGAKYKIDGRKVYITGKTNLKGTIVTSTDLRGGASLVVAGLIADGTTIVEDAEHILRGYSNIIDKLQNVGAKIKIED